VVLTVPSSTPHQNALSGNGIDYNTATSQASHDTEIGCPHCARAILADPNLAGQTVGCPYCGGNMVMPGARSPQPVRQVAGPAITLRCPHCQSMQIFDGSLAGQIVTCPQCRLALQVPAPQGQVVGSLSASTRPRDQFEFGSDREEELISRRRHRNRGNGTWRWSWDWWLSSSFPFWGRWP
jgi:transcription elongation factor Elf1